MLSAVAGDFAAWRKISAKSGGIVQQGRDRLGRCEYAARKNDAGVLGLVRLRKVANLFPAVLNPTGVTSRV